MFYINNKYKYKINNNKIYFILFLLFYYVNCNKITNNSDDYDLINLIKRSTVIISGFGIKNNNNCTSASLNSQNLKKYRYNDNNNCGYSNKNYVKINLLPKTVYKGNELVRKLELYRESQYFIYRGQLNATLLYRQEDEQSIQQQAESYGKPPYANKRVKFQKNDNNTSSTDSTTRSILDLLPRQLIIFGTLNTNNKLNTSTQIIINRNGLREWSQNIENKIWKFLGWSEWSKFTPCSVTCGKGVQQRYRYCFNSVNSNNLNGKLATVTKEPSPSSSSHESQATQQMKLQSSKTIEHHHQQQQQHNKKGAFTSMDDNYSNDCSIEGYNIEQRNCNIFKCTGLGMVDLLFNFNISINAAISVTTSTPSITSPSIPLSTSTSSSIATFELDNNRINKHNFTIMMAVNLKNFTEQNTNNLLTIRSDNDSEIGAATQSLSVEFIENQFQLLHEKFNYAEKFEIKSGINPFTNEDHYLSISITNGNIITNYYNCIWENTYMLSKNFMKLNKFLQININVNLIENSNVKQLIIINNNNNNNNNDVSTRQCSNDITYIRDDEIFIKTKNFY